MPGMRTARPAAAVLAGKIGFLTGPEAIKIADSPLIFMIYPCLWHTSRARSRYIRARNDMADPLDRDLAKFKELLPTLTASEGKFALIYKADLKGIFQSYEDALQEGYKLAGLDPFLVKKIAASEMIAYFTRDLGTECRI